MRLDQTHLRARHARGTGVAFGAGIQPQILVIPGSVLWSTASQLLPAPTGQPNAVLRALSGWSLYSVCRSLNNG